MKPLETLVFSFNVILWLLGIVFMFAMDFRYGLVSLLCFLLFLILFFKAQYFIISRLDKFVNSEWQLFMVRLKWANGQAFVILVVISFIIAAMLKQ
jgi:hypothetical protein